MTGVVFIVNIPWTMLGLLLAVASGPRNLHLHKRPFAFVVSVNSFWWQTWHSSYKGVRAASIGNVVLLGPNLLPHDLKHELIHVEQYQREPFVHAFLLVLETVRHGYKRNKYEVEAYRKAGNKYVE